MIVAVVARLAADEVRVREFLSLYGHRFQTLEPIVRDFWTRLVLKAQAGRILLWWVADFPKEDVFYLHDWLKGKNIFGLMSDFGLGYREPVYVFDNAGHRKIADYKDRVLEWWFITKDKTWVYYIRE